jgi:hypothetical protein
MLKVQSGGQTTMFKFKVEVLKACPNEPLRNIGACCLNNVKKVVSILEKSCPLIQHGTTSFISTLVVLFSF